MDIRIHDIDPYFISNFVDYLELSWNSISIMGVTVMGRLVGWRGAILREN